MERGVYMCICVCICANNMQILGFGGVGGVRSGGGYHWGGRGGVWGSGDRAHIYVCVIPYWLTTLQLHHQVTSLNKETMTNLPDIAPPCNLDAMRSLGLAKWGANVARNSNLRGQTTSTWGNICKPVVRCCVQ